MAGRIKVYENGAPLNSEDTPALIKEPDVVSAYDESCGTFGVGDYTRDSGSLSLRNGTRYASRRRTPDKGKNTMRVQWRLCVVTRTPGDCGSPIYRAAAKTRFVKKVAIDL